MSQSEIELLKAENTKLQRMLALAQAWMKREVEASTMKISKRKATQASTVDRDEFFRQNQEAMNSAKISKYFGEILLMNVPKQTIEHLIDSEISYFYLQRNPTGDGVGVVGSYNKIIDALVESFVTAQFRKFAIKRGAVILRTNDPLEKAIHFVITKKYILSSGRLYALLRGIRKGEKMYEYGELFRLYLEKYPTIGDFLLSDAFYKPFSTLIESEIFAGKRHEGKVSLEETTKTRELLTGNFVDKNGILHQFLSSQAGIY